MLLQTEVVAGRGDGHLEAITLADHSRGSEVEVTTNWLFVFIGASPRTDWLGGDVARDDKGFVITGQDLRRRQGPDAAGPCPVRRSPSRPACPACSRPVTSASTR